MCLTLRLHSVTDSELIDIASVACSGLSVIPSGASTPAATGISVAL